MRSPRLAALCEHSDTYRVCSALAADTVGRSLAVLLRGTHRVSSGWSHQRLNSGEGVQLASGEPLASSRHSRRRSSIVVHRLRPPKPYPKLNFGVRLAVARRVHNCRWAEPSKVSLGPNSSDSRPRDVVESEARQRPRLSL